MSEDKNTDNDPERTLVTLEQLSQTIEVMTSVVNRLRQHLSEQLQAKLAEQKKLLESAAGEQGSTDSASQIDQRTEAIGKPARTATQEAAQDILKGKQKQQHNETQQRESFVVEIRQQEPEPVRKNDKTLH
jgi:basic membrane lipoprotein Med (substrate-binding protein (PBP1-ABC) superfamily)